MNATQNIEPLSLQNMLVCLFSYNRTSELRILLESFERCCPGYDLIVIDDASTNPETRVILQEKKYLLKEMILQEPVAKTSSRGRLAQNIQRAYDKAIALGYQYLFMIQDDMQFVRPLDEKTLAEYSEIFASDPATIEIDPRFLRRLGKIDIDRQHHCYSFPEADDRRSFADVGILCIPRLQAVNWAFENSERQNKVKAHALGLRRAFPFTPIFMHLPYPVIYRKGKRKNKFPSPFLKRGAVSYDYMNESECKAMDERPIEEIPYVRDNLKPRGLGVAWLHYRFASEGKIFC